MINEALLKNEELAVFGLRSLYSAFGYTQYKMSTFEEYDLYVRNKDFLISDRVITFTDTNGKLLALKPDVTLSIITNLGKSIEGIHKMYYNENVYRVSGATGRFKEIMQTGLECIGDIGIYETAEVLYLAIKSLALTDGNFRLEIAHASLLSELLTENGVGKDILGEVLEAVKIKSSGLTDALLTAGKINVTQAEMISVLCRNFPDFASFAEAVAPFVTEGCSEKLFNEFRDIVISCENEETKGKISINFSLASDAGYYSGIVFKGYINGIPQSVLSGGQYDKLMEKLGNKGGAVGFAVYLDSFERFGENADEYDIDTVLLVTDNDSPADILKAAEKIRSTGEGVCVVKSVPTDLRYRRVLTVEGL